MCIRDRSGGRKYATFTSVFTAFSDGVSRSRDMITDGGEPDCDLRTDERGTDGGETDCDPGTDADSGMDVDSRTGIDSRTDGDDGVFVKTILFCSINDAIHFFSLFERGVPFPSRPLIASIRSTSV